VIRFDTKRGYGFLTPDEGGEDVFVHQNNISMEGFRYLRVGERVSYELEVGEKGMKAVSVALLEPRPPQPPRGDFDGPGRRDFDGPPRRDFDAPPRRDYAAPRRDAGGDDAQVEKLRRTQERLISLLVEKGLIAPGEIDAVNAALDG
jgi:cold shock CspA family protein